MNASGYPFSTANHVSAAKRNASLPDVHPRGILLVEKYDVCLKGGK